MKHILLVDDSTTNLKSAGSVLQDHYKVSMAKSGRQALNFLKKNKPDLILLDLLMPEMDGYQTMEEIKLNPQTANIPIIFLTADKQRESEIKGLQLGALDFITKPFEEEVMISRIEKVLAMDDMRRGLLEEADKDVSTGLFTLDYVKNVMSEHLSADKGGEIVLISIENYAELFEHASSKSVAAYLDYIYEYFLDSHNGNNYVCGLDENTFMMNCLDVMDETEFMDFLTRLYGYLDKDVEDNDGKRISVSIKIGGALCHGYGNFEDYFARADKAFYHVKNTDFLNIHIYKGK